MRDSTAACAALSCTNPGDLIEGVPLCGTHRARLALALAEVVERPTISEYHAIVYYVTWDGGETVKIGTTTNPKSRFNSLSGTAGKPVDLLVAHPGGYEEEKTNHHRFRHLRIKGECELFRQGPELVDHIANVKAAWPNWKQIVNEVAWRRAGKKGRGLYAVANAAP